MPNVVIFFSELSHDKENKILKKKERDREGALGYWIIKSVA